MQIQTEIADKMPAVPNQPLPATESKESPIKQTGTKSEGKIGK
jgi:hypothetical protein